MTYRDFLILGIIFILITSVSCLPNNLLNGHWEGSWKFTDGSYVEKFSFDLTESGNTITGSGLDEKGVTAKVSGKIEDTSITLTVLPEDGSAPIVFSGEIDKKLIHGTWQVGDASGPWSASKI